MATQMVSGGNKPKSDWSNLLLPCGACFALLGYIWIGNNDLVGYALMLTGLGVGFGGMLQALRRENPK